MAIEERRSLSDDDIVTSTVRGAARPSTQRGTVAMADSDRGDADGTDRGDADGTDRGDSTDSTDRGDRGDADGTDRG